MGFQEADFGTTVRLEAVGGGIGNVRKGGLGREPACDSVTREAPPPIPPGNLRLERLIRTLHADPEHMWRELTPCGRTCLGFQLLSFGRTVKELQVVEKS